MPMPRLVLRAALCLLFLLPFQAHAAQSPLSDREAMYPRVVRISHDASPAHNGTIIATVTSFNGGGHEDVFASTDNGVSFTLAGKIEDAAFAKGLCCGGLYELPAAIGALSAGTLLWSGSVGADTPTDPMQMRVYKSTDQGAHWSYLSNCVTAARPRNQGGLWEAEFTIAANGHLVCFYSDETQDGHSQILRYVQSTDGLTWSAPVDVVSSPTQADRPGMANIVKLPDGRYLMSFEMCGPLNCATFLKSSADGLDWGDPADHGTAIATADGTTFWHTPTLHWAPVAGSTTGQLVLQGQILVRNGVVQPGNGQTVLINAAGDGTGDWVAFTGATAITMPSGTAGNYCQNYSTPLLALDNGQTLLSLASDFAGTACKTWFNRAPLGGVKGAASGNISVARGGTAFADISFRSSANYAGDYTISASVPDLPGGATLSTTTLTLSAVGDTSVRLTVSPATVADSGQRHIRYAGFGGLGLLVAWLFGRGVVSRRRHWLLLVLLGVPLILSGCGGGGGGGGGSSSPSTPPVTSKTYTGTVTATSVSDPAVSVSVPISVTVTG